MEKQIYTIGFSTGCLYKTHNIKEALQELKKLPCNAIELNLLGIKEFFNDIDAVTKDELAPFDHVSMHAPKPKGSYNSHDPETSAIFKRLEELYKRYTLDLIVFHPNIILDFSIFKNAHFPFAFENLDYRLTSGKYNTPEGMKDLFAALPAAPMVLDVNHIFTVDNSMQYAKKFYEIFGDRIKQIHASGCVYTYHAPLFRSKQDSIICSIQNKNVPIIIESILDAKDLKKEYEYIIKILNK